MLPIVSAEPAHAVRCLKSHQGHSVWLTHPPGSALRTRKVWPISLWILLKCVFGIAQPQRQVRGAKRLRAAGLATPAILQPLRIDFRSRILSLELAHAEGQTALQALLDGQLSVQQMMACAAAIGALVPRIADAKLFNRDLKLSNLIVFEEDDGWLVWLIDPVGVRLQRNRTEELTRMLHRLASEPEVMSIAIPGAVRVALMHSALTPMSRAERREVLRRLREHRPH